jgi:ribosomal protein L11 methyltransferase
MDLEQPRQVIRLRVEADSQLVEIISDYLVGILDGAVEYLVDDEAGGQTIIHGYIGVEVQSAQVQNELEHRVRTYGVEIARICNADEPRISSEFIQGQDWAESWKEHFKPFEIIPGLIIAPSWEPSQKPQDGHLIVMDPGMAFGTGHHATTRLCLAMLKRLVLDGCRSTLDVGTGTGILAMAAACFGADRVVGIDHDPAAVAAARKNVQINDLSAAISVTDRDVSTFTEDFELVVANIVHDVLICLAEDLARLTRAGGYLVLSGLISGAQVESIVREFGSYSMVLQDEAREAEWSGLLLKKNAVVQ